MFHKVCKDHHIFSDPICIAYMGVHSHQITTTILMFYSWMMNQTTWSIIWNILKNILNVDSMVYVGVSWYVMMHYFDLFLVIL
jgi:hypothetical protein